MYSTAQCTAPCADGAQPSTQAQHARKIEAEAKRKADLESAKHLGAEKIVAELEAYVAAQALAAAAGSGAKKGKKKGKGKKKKGKGKKKSKKKK